MDEHPVEIEIEDTVAGLEKYNQSQTYSARKFRGKNGIILVLDASENEEKEDEKVRGLSKKVELLKANCAESIPITIILNKKDLLEKNKQA